MTSLKERWKAFGIILLDPWLIILFISTIFLSIVLIRQSDVVIISILTFLVSLFSGVLGGIVAKRWDDLTEGKVIVARAKSANRSLQLLLSSVIALEKRVRLYTHRHNDPSYKSQITPEVVKTYLEEIIEDSLGLEEKVINSIEDWKDILPNLEVKTVINLIRELNGNYTNTLSQLEQVNLSLQETKDKSEADVKKLNEEKSEIKKELFRIQRELQEKSIQFGVPSISGSLITGSSTLFSTSSPTLIGSPADSKFLTGEYGTTLLQSEPSLKIKPSVTVLDELKSKDDKK